MANQRRGLDEWPPGYPAYFDDRGIVRREYIIDLPLAIAERFRVDGLTRSQLQAFYRRVRLLGDSLEFVSEQDSLRVLRKLEALVPLANYSRNRGVIPEVFYDFLKRNIDKCSDSKTVRHGFVEHFQAIVGFCKLNDDRGGG